MKLYTTTTSERGKPVSKSGNEKIEIELTIDRVAFGRVIMRYEEANGFTVYYYPITEVTGEGGRVLFHEEKSKHMCKNCDRKATKPCGYCAEHCPHFVHR